MEKEKFDLENFPTSSSAQKMISYVSGGFYDKSYVGKWIYQVLGIEYDKVLEMVEDLPAQYFPETATWGLMFHEVKWGLQVHPDLSYEERRRLIYEKRDYRAPMTPYHMEKYLETMTGFKVSVSDSHDLGEHGFISSHPNLFKVYFSGEKLLDAKSVKRLIDKIKQSHTEYVINHWIEDVIYNSSLEKAVFIKLDVKMAFYFWGMRLLDGSWMLDGSVGLCQKPTYALNAALVIGGIEAKNRESIGNDKVTVRKDLWYLDGNTRLDGSRKLDAEVREEDL